MPRLVYACRFEVPKKDGLKFVLSSYSDWIQNHYRVRRGLKGFTLDLNSGVSIKGQLPRHSILIDQFESTKGQAARLEWAYPADKDDGLVWRNEVRIGQFDARASVEHLIWIDSIVYNIAPFQLALGSPSVIGDLCSASVVHIGDMEIKASPYRLNQESLEDFLTLLRSTLRRVPIVFLAPYAGGEANLIDPDQMARRLACVGIVVVADEIDVTWDLSDELGRSLSCFDGAARIYWPGFNDEDDPRRHPLYLGARIEVSGSTAVSRAIERSVFAVAAFRYAPDGRISDVIADFQQSQRTKRLEAEKNSGATDWEAYALEMDAELTAAKQTLSELQSENENLKANQQIVFSAIASGEPEEIVSSDEIVVPDSVASAVRQAKKHRSLVLLDSAIEAAAECPFQRPAEVAEALQDLNEVAKDWAEQRKLKGSGGDLRQHLIKRGWGKRCSMHISDTTKGRYGNSYIFEYEGKKLMFEPHITLGSGDANSCASIHFILDEKGEKIVVGHVGKHLPNTKK